MISSKTDNIHKYQNKLLLYYTRINKSPTAVNQNQNNSEEIERNVKFQQDRFRLFSSFSWPG